MTKSANVISAENAFTLLNEGVPIVDTHIEGQLRIETTRPWKQPLIFKNCTLEFFSGNVTRFDKPVRLINCHFKKCDFTFSYFPGGLMIDRCSFDNYLDFQAGGHTNHPVIISNCIFNGFVNFFDYQYEAAVNISNNEFRKGSNLLGNPNNISVIFEVKPVIENNTGKLDCNDEGDYEDKAVYLIK